MANENARHRAQIHSWEIEAICKLAREKSRIADELGTDVGLLDVIDGWFDVYSPVVEYIVDPFDGSFDGAILHHEQTPKKHTWTMFSASSLGRTYCTLDSGEMSFVETDCTELYIYIENEYQKHLY